MVKSLEMGAEKDEDELPLPPSCCGTFSCHGMDENHAKTNQDCACIAYPLKADESAGAFIVLDGHGEDGDVVSNELLQQMYDRIDARSWDASDETAAAQLISAFEGAHEHMRSYRVDAATGEAPAQQSGAVGVTMLLRRGRMMIAHAGDARAILGTTGEDGSLLTVDLTADHKLELPEERARIEATGAYIRPGQETPYFKPSRVYVDAANPCAGPGLTMSRSLGDIDADACGVVPTPELSFRTIDRQRDRFVVLASDGVWEFLSSKDVAEIVAGFLARGEPASAATRFLIAKAALAWRTEEDDYRDDITAIVLYLQELPADLVAEVQASASA